MSASERMPSILQVVSYYPPDRLGGVGEAARVIHEGHRAVGVDTEVLTSGATHSDPHVHRIGTSPHRFVLMSWLGLKYADGRDVVHVHHGEALLFLLLLRLKRSRPRILVMYHVDVRKREAASRFHIFEGKRFGASRMAMIPRRLTGFIKVAFERASWMFADCVVVEAESVRNELSDLLPNKDISVIRYGLASSAAIDVDLPDPVHLLFVGTPGIRKRTHLLPAILWRVRKRVPSAQLRVVGFNLEDDPGMESEARRLDVLSAIEFVGALKSSDVIGHYRSAEVLVHPAAYEGLPLAILEAMREGLAPVATDVSGHPEAIEDGVNGYLVSVDDVDGIAKRCVELLQSPGLRNDMGERARATVRDQFSLMVELEAYLDLYRQLDRTGPAARR